MDHVTLLVYKRRDIRVAPHTPARVGQERGQKEVLERNTGYPCSRVTKKLREGLRVNARKSQAVASTHGDCPL